MLDAACIELLHCAQEDAAQDDDSTQSLNGSAEALTTTKETFCECIKCLVKKALPAVFWDEVGFPLLWKWVHDIDVGDTKPLRKYGQPLTLPEHHESIKKFYWGQRVLLRNPMSLPWRTATRCSLPGKPNTRMLSMWSRPLQQHQRNASQWSIHPWCHFIVGWPKGENCTRASVTGISCVTCLVLLSSTSTPFAEIWCPRNCILEQKTFVFIGFK